MHGLETFLRSARFTSGPTPLHKALSALTALRASLFSLPLFHATSEFNARGGESLSTIVESSGPGGVPEAHNSTLPFTTQGRAFWLQAIQRVETPFLLDAWMDLAYFQKYGDNRKEA